MENEKPVSDGTVSAPETTTPPTPGGAATPPPGEDKFMQATHKFVGAIERAIAWVFRTLARLTNHPNFEPRTSIRVIDGLLVGARTHLPPEKYESVAAWMARSGHTGLLAAQVITLLYYIVAAIKIPGTVYLLHGIGIAALLIVLQYAAERFMSAGDSLIRTSPTRMNSGAFLDCLALLLAIGGVLLFIVSVMQARDLRSWSPVWVGLGYWALCTSVAYVALNPSMANTAVVSGGSAGEEAIGIMSFFVKAVIRIVPLAFGIGAIIGSVALFVAIFSLVRDGSLAAGKQALTLIGLCAILPFATYLFFVLYHLMIDVIRAILAIPEKLDRR